MKLIKDCVWRFPTQNWPDARSIRLQPHDLLSRRPRRFLAHPVGVVLSSIRRDLSEYFREFMI